MTVFLSPVGGVASQFFDNNGNVLTGGKIYTYAAGTTTPQTTYTSVSGNTAHTNPIILDAAGRVPGGELWVTSGVVYKFVLKTSTDVLIGTYDNVTGIISVLDAAQVTYTPAGTGAVTTTVQAKLRQIVSIADFGGYPNATTNTAIALQAAHDALPGSGGTIYIPDGGTYYLFTSGVSFTKPIRLVGGGIYSSVFYTVTSTITLITTTNKLDAENLHFEAYGAARSTSVFIEQAAASGGNSHSTYFNCLFDGGAVCYHSLYTSAVVFDNCGIYPVGTYGLYLENTTNSDQGDSFIINCTFSGATVANIFAPTTSGLYVTNNKFNDSFAHVLISTGASNTGNYTFTGNSFEGHTSYAIQLVATTGTITKTLITGNQFSSGTVGTAMNHIIIGKNAVNNAITGNTFNSTNAAETLHTSILIQADSFNTTLTGNAFHQIYNGISCAANATLGITMSGNRFASDVNIVQVGNNNSTFGLYGSNLDIPLSRYFQETAGTLTTAYRFQGSGTLEVIIYGVAQGSGNVLYTRKVAMYDTTTTSDINAAVAQGSAITVAFTSAAGYMNLQIAKSAGTSFTGYVEVIARGQISYIKRV